MNTTQTVDQRCAMLASRAANHCFHAMEYRTRFPFYTPEHREWLARQQECTVPDLADRIIALREGEAKGVQS